MPIIIDVYDAMTTASELSQINQQKDLRKVEFHYDGLVINIPESEIKEFELVGLSVMDFIRDRDWPTNPIYD